MARSGRGGGAEAPYRYPEYYDIAFDVNRKAECDFLEACFARYSPGPVRAVLDLACGTGQHLLRLARRGYRVTGLDLSPENIVYLRAKARRQAVEVQTMVGDMANFRVRAPVDAAICMQDSQGHLLTNEALLRHLGCVGRALRPGGLYIFDRLIPSRWATPTMQWAWTRRRGGTSVRTTFTTLRAIDPVEQICEETIRFEITTNGARRVITQRHRTRIVFPQELRALVALAGNFELVEWFANFDIHRPLGSTRAPLLMISVLRRR